MSIGQAITPADLQHAIAVMKRRLEELPVGSDERSAMQTQLFMRQRRLEKMLQLNAAHTCTCNSPACLAK